MDKKKLVRISIVALSSILFILFVFLLLPRLLILFLPFVIAYLLAKLIQPAVKFLHDKLRVPQKLAAAFSILITVGILGWALFALISRLWAELNNILEQSDVIADLFESRYTAFRDSFAGRLGFADELEKLFSGFGTRLSEQIASYISPAIRSALNVVKSVPSVIIFIVVMILATFFISSDHRQLTDGIHRFTPRLILRAIESCVQNMFTALGAYLKAQLLLMCITFFELSIGFLIIGSAAADYALLLALIISIIDAIPILGTGTVLIPWGVYALVIGDIRLGIMLLILYLVCLTVRQITEPHLVAHRIGLHPLITLMSMYAGLRLFGFFGMILGPILVLIVKNMQDSGLFHTIQMYIDGQSVETDEIAAEKGQ